MRWFDAVRFRWAGLVQVAIVRAPSPALRKELARTQKKYMQKINRTPKKYTQTRAHTKKAFRTKKFDRTQANKKTLYTQNRVHTKNILHTVRARTNKRIAHKEFERTPRKTFYTQRSERTTPLPKAPHKNQSHTQNRAHRVKCDDLMLCVFDERGLFK